MQQFLAEFAPLPDQYFWYVIATLFGGALLFLLKRDMDKKDAILNKLVDAVSLLQTQGAVHTEQIKHLQEDVTSIKEKE